ncbi:DUF4421 family protein [Paraflavitalea speifideaquila]|uniref:DUF4421 family protein n=1 Tax=Paraflavitalea speifideaquila TaxID=3076558 RepID=UPI0028E4EB3F|nr:DUF4421 family protein [Paraflavitalea speifideiaquila]
MSNLLLLMRICLLLLSFSYSILCAQIKPTDSMMVAPVSSGKIEPMSEWLTLWLTQSTDVEKLAVKSPATEIRLSPNASTVTRIGVSYRFISAYITWVPRFLPGNNDDVERGKTKGAGLALAFNGRHWLQELSYSRTKGYYIENTDRFDPSWSPGKLYIQFPDLVFTQYQGSTAYNFNASFSVNALSTLSERQLKSAGSFIPQLLYRYYINDNKAAPAPGGSNQKGTNLEILLGAGYFYNFVLQQRWYAALGMAPNAGYIFSRITTRYGNGTTGKGNQANFILRLDARAGIGYNGPRFFRACMAVCWNRPSDKVNRM